MKDFKEWKKKLAELLKEYPDIVQKFTGQIEMNMNEGGLTKIFIHKELK